MDQLRRLTLFLLLFCHWRVNGQVLPKAEFTIDKTEGCAPLVASFSNTSTGLTNAATFSWDFGNGNTSLLPSPKASYIRSGTYTITLTVNDAGKTASVSHTITIHDAPTVDFSLSSAKGCAPYEVKFTSASTAGAGTIIGYAWDFGDGNTIQTTTTETQHTYLNAAAPIISLTVTNSYGCQSNATKNDLLKVLPEIKAAFNADKNYLCTLNEQVSFLNSSSGPPTLSYTWDFGDGTQSNEKQPSHQYANTGSFPVSLTVRSTEGCSASTGKDFMLNVANFKDDFTTTGPACDSNLTEFINNSFPIPESTTWLFDDGLSIERLPGEEIKRAFFTPGKHLVRIRNQYGSCRTDFSKEITINPLPIVTFIDNKIEGECGSPVNVKFSATAPTAVSWHWYFGSDELGSDEQNPNHLFQRDGEKPAALTVYDINGCRKDTNTYLNIQKPSVAISMVPERTNNYSTYSSCGPNTIHFSAITNANIIQYKWDFGDGTGSTEANPSHTYTKEGTYIPSLQFLTDKGCTGTITSGQGIGITDPVSVDFAASQTDVCGNTPVEFTNTSAKEVYMEIHFGDGSLESYSDTRSFKPVHQYQQEGTYTVMAIFRYGVCMDTVTKKDYIKVSGPFPKITGVTNTCEGTRGKVILSQASTETEQWTWDFADGSTQTLTTNQPQVEHTYTQSGYYYVTLTAKKNTCVVSDHIPVYVMLKQNPVISVNKPIVCANGEDLTITAKNITFKPINGGNMETGYDGALYKYGDGTRAFGYSNHGNVHVDLGPDYVIFNWHDFDISKSNLKAYFYSYPFGCIDSTNEVIVQFKGPQIDFRQINKTPCRNDNIAVVEDLTTSKTGTPLVSWEWDWGDGTREYLTQGGNSSHQFEYPSTYPITLTVKDADGCYGMKYGTVETTQNSLKADFNASATNISPGTAIQFTNTTILYEPGDIQYEWQFGDGSSSTDRDANKTYTQPGNYTVRLIARNITKGCSDTATALIIVKYINAAFQFNTSFIQSSNCPPVLVNFTNTSTNITSINWDFGDGATAENVYAPSHIYTKPGFYLIKATATSENGTVYSTIDSIRITAQQARLTADQLFGCTDQNITLKAAQSNAIAYSWDFGDGTVQTSNDSSILHYYSNPGIYQPILVATNQDGCSISSPLPEKIIIDELNIGLQNLPATICTPKSLDLIPTIESVSGNISPDNLSYHWDFGTGIAGDTANTRNAVANYNTIGEFTIRLAVNSKYGCQKTVSRKIQALQGLGANIIGPDKVCEGSTVQFFGNTLIAGNPTWDWTFSDGSKSKEQNPAPLLFTSPGSQIIQLAVNNKGCIDTVKKSIIINGIPRNILPLHQANVCEGSPIDLQASGGDQYSWAPATGLSTSSGAAIQANPAADTRYTVTATTAEGCSAKDSISLTVTHPFALELAPEIAVCEGIPVQLEASGGYSYQWIGNTAGLSNTAIANPVLNTTETGLYSVVGTDRNNCFSDTANINVEIFPKPVVNAGNDTTLLPGSNYLLTTYYSADVSDIRWSPSSYLSCTTCPGPETRPLQTTQYTVTVKNEKGCIAIDTVMVAVKCINSRIYIPNAFTPNRDGRNETFHIRADGVSVINFLRIYNRFGQMVFEQKNFRPGDPNTEWDGRFNGQAVPAGTYVYFMELTCVDERITEKGTVIISY